jgi:polysaccharide export outer membrane protein
MYLQGQVKAPGTYPVTLHMTLEMALARAGGITDLGSSRNIKVTRDNKEIEPPDMTFQILPNDVIAVGESWF